MRKLSFRPAIIPLASLVLLSGVAGANPVAFNNVDGYLRWTSSDAGGGALCGDGFFPFPAVRYFDPTLSPIQSGETGLENAICCVGIPPSTGCSTATQAWTISDTRAGFVSTNYTYPVGCCGSGCTGTSPGPQALNPGDTVGPSSTFSRVVTTASASMVVGNTQALSAGPKFIGLKLRINGNTHYGWMRVSTRPGRAQFPEYDVTHWGFETAPLTPIQIPSTLPPAPVIEVAQTITFQSGQAPVGQPDPFVFGLAAPAGTQFGLLTGTQCSAAQTGASPMVQNLSGEVLLSGAAAPTSGLYDLPFTLPASFGAFVQSRLIVDSSDTLGSNPGGFFPALGPRSQDYLINCVWRGDGVRNNNSRELREAWRALHVGVNHVALNVFSGSPATFTGRVEISPARRIDIAPAFVPPGGTVQLSGLVINSYDPNFTWSVPGGPSQGSVSASGVYTAPLTPGTYTVRATSHELGLALTPLFSSNGTVTVVCPADFNHDGNTDPDDLGDFITCFFQNPIPACPAADFNHDNTIDPDDLGDFITTFFSGAC